MQLLRFEERMRSRPSMSRGLQATENRANLFDPPRMLERVHLDKESSFSFLKVGARFEQARTEFATPRRLHFGSHLIRVIRRQLSCL